jgi:hypothetical protein
LAAALGAAAAGFLATGLAGFLDLRSTGMETPRLQRNEYTAPQKPGAGKEKRGVKCELLEASGLGEHLECSPCGKVASRALVSRLAGPGGAAVALAKHGLYPKRWP